MFPQSRKCEVCGSPMEYKTYASKAAETMFTEYKCTNCGAVQKETALLSMVRDNKKILRELDALEEKAGEFPWP